jgi:hypothetical protein
MQELTVKAQKATDQLVETDLDYLFDRLGTTLRVVSIKPELSGDFELDVSSDVEALGPLDGIADFGRRYFLKVEVQVHRLICSADEKQDRQKLAHAFGLGREAVAATIAALLVSSLGFAPAVAAVLAAISIKVFFEPAQETMCEQWDERLKALKGS